MNDKLKQTEELINTLLNDCDFFKYAYKDSSVHDSSAVDISKGKLIYLVSQLVEENKQIKHDANKISEWSHKAKLKAEKKAFWWASEFTETLHNNNIQKAWENYKRQQALDELTALSQEMGEYDDDELPGMWSSSDLIGGEADCNCDSESDKSN